MDCTGRLALAVANAKLGDRTQWATTYLSQYQPLTKGIQQAAERHH